MTEWHILTGEYPPQPGGVSDYARLVASGLAQTGDRVCVWSSPCSDEGPQDDGVEVHRLPDHFGLCSLRRLQRSFKHTSRSRRILVQYVPHAFGWKALNLPFCIWLWSRRHRDSIWVMFHEVYFPMNRKQPAAHNLLGVGTRIMASLVGRAAERIFVSIPAWKSLLKPLTSGRAPVTCLPVPSLIPRVDDKAGSINIRARYAPASGGLIIGHFGTNAPHIAQLLKSLLPLLLVSRTDRSALLLGRAGCSLRDELLHLYPELTGRVHATGPLLASDLSRHLSACDVMVQPFGDGVSGRRTSVMTALEHGLPIVTTSGALTESLWAESGAVKLVPVEDVVGQARATEHLLADAELRKILSVAATKLYRERFDARHTLSALRAAEPPKSRIL